MKRYAIDIKLPAIQFGSEIFEKEFESLRDMQARLLVCLVYLDELDGRINKFNTIGELLNIVMNINSSSFVLIEHEIVDLIKTKTIIVKGQEYKSVFDVVIANVEVVDKVKSRISQNNFIGLKEKGIKNDFYWYVSPLDESFKLNKISSKNLSEKSEFKSDILQKMFNRISGQGNLKNFVEIYKNNEDENKFYGIDIFDITQTFIDQQIVVEIGNGIILEENIFTKNILSSANEIKDDLDVFKHIEQYLMNEVLYHLDTKLIKVDSNSPSEVNEVELNKILKDDSFSFIDGDVRISIIDNKYYILINTTEDIFYGEEKVFVANKYMKQEINLNKFLNDNVKLIDFSKLKTNAPTEITNFMIKAGLSLITSEKKDSIISYLKKVSANIPMKENDFWEVIKLIDTPHQLEMIRININWLNTKLNIQKLKSFNENISYEELYKIFKWDLDENYFPEWTLQSKASRTQKFITDNNTEKFRDESAEGIKNIIKDYFDNNLELFEIKNYSQYKSFLSNTLKQLENKESEDENSARALKLRKKIESFVGGIQKGKTFPQTLNSKFVSNEDTDELIKIFKFFSNTYIHETKNKNKVDPKSNLILLNEYESKLDEILNRLERRKK